MGDAKTYWFNPFFFLVFFTSLYRKLRNQKSLNKKASSRLVSSQFNFQRYQRPGSLSKPTIVFDVEGALLKSSSLFPYFMLVAFEAGGLLRALVLFLIYPFVCLLSKDRGIKTMVMVCFFGLKKDSFRVGRAVLPKFFMEDVGLEGFQLLMRGGRKVGVSDIPRVMVEGFLKEYLEVDMVVGKELKVFRGYYLGLVEHNQNSPNFNEIFREEASHVIGIGSFHKPLHPLFSLCKEMHMVSDAEKSSSWEHLPKAKYPKPLVFHDGRLALRPTPLATLALLIWLPFALPLVIFRGIVFLLLPSRISNPIVAFTGVRLRISKQHISSNPCQSSPPKKKGVLYVCNHRTLMDPLYLSAVIDKPLTAVTYSLSRISELLAPIKNVRLTRDRQVDAKMMDDLLSKGDLVICPEGTTCREPYLLRFSSLFAEMGDEIVPVAIDSYVTMFHGTTASGLKCFDPLFYVMNPFPTYHVKLLKPVSGTSRCADDGGEARVRTANHVQKQIGQALGFECTKLTRRDKYLMLAGNEGVVMADAHS